MALSSGCQRLSCCVLQVWFMIAGEMGRSVIKYPTQYMALVSKYRGALARGKTGANVKVGLALHWNKVCGNCFNVPNPGTAAQFNASYAQVGAADPVHGQLYN